MSKYESLLDRVQQSIENNSSITISFRDEKIKSELIFYPLETTLDNLGLYIEDKDGHHFYVKDIDDFKLEYVDDICYRLTSQTKGYYCELDFS